MSIALALIAALLGSLATYFLISLWPQRIPRDITVDAIRERVEHEDGE
ncbi:hypothetical protein ACWDSJ_10435 [Nocardia sp. NPDC003482]